MKNQKLTKEDKRDIRAKKQVIRAAEQLAIRIQAEQYDRDQIKAAFIKNNTENANVPYDSVLSAYQELSKNGTTGHADFGVIGRACRWTIEALHDKGNGCNRFIASVKDPAFSFAIILACMYPQLLIFNQTISDLCLNCGWEMPTEFYDYDDRGAIKAFVIHIHQVLSLLTTDAKKVVFSSPTNFAVFLDRVLRQHQEIGHAMALTCYPPPRSVHLSPPSGGLFH